MYFEHSVYTIQTLYCSVLFSIAVWTLNGTLDVNQIPVCLSGNNGSAPGAQPDLRMRRQHSSDSVSSITSATSHSSLGSNMDNPDSSSKKKKKNWVSVQQHKKQYKKMIHPNMTILSSFTPVWVSFFCWIHKKIIWRMLLPSSFQSPPIL